MNEMTNDAAVAWRYRRIDSEEGPSLWIPLDEAHVATAKGMPNHEVEPLYSATTVAELRAEVERLRADALRYRQLKNGRRQPFGDTFIIKKFNRTFGEEESVSWSDMEREIDAEIAALTKETP